MKFSRLLMLFATAVAMNGQTAQTWDTSGNSMLSGTYYFRQVYYVLGDQYGDLGEAVTMYGNMSFDGKGNYSITTASNAQYLDYSYSSGGVVGGGAITSSGTYGIALSGYGYITSPFPPTSGDLIYGVVSSSGVFVGSSTDNGFGYNDMMIAAPVASPLPTASSFTGNWTGAVFDFSSGTPVASSLGGGALSLMLTMNPDGNGNLNVSSINGYLGGVSQAYTQTAPGVKYLFSNGAAVATFAANGSLLSGQKYFYFSKDGNFMFGGSPITSNTPFDMIVAVKTSTASPTLAKLYYQAGIDNNNGDLDTYFGSFNVAGSGSQTFLGHQRINDFAGTSVYDYTYTNPITLTGNSSSNSVARFVVGSGDPTTGGSILLTSGVAPYLGLSVALQAPPITPTGTVFIDPTRVQNSASNAPFTTGIAPGELITLYGTNLAGGTQTAGIPFPTTGLGGVQVTIGGLPAAIYYVSPGQLSAVVPYGIQSAAPCFCAQIQVNNNGTLSNVVTEYIAATAPGVFTQNQTGLGYGDIEHLGIGNSAATAGAVVTDANPAIEGETLAAYLTGLGTVTPQITDGAPGPSDTLSKTDATIGVDFSGIAGTNGFSGLAPGYSGLYQMNFTIPATGITTLGANYLDVQGSDSYMSYQLMPIQATAPTTASVSEPKPELAIPSRLVRKAKAGPSQRLQQPKKSFPEARTRTDNQSRH